MVKKTDGTVPSEGAISKAARDFKDLKKKRGRKKGCKATTKAEDKKILQVFNKLRPPGHGVDSRVVHQALPLKIKKKVGRRSVIRRLADKGYHPEKKINKSDPGPALAKKRIKFSKIYRARKSSLVGVGDFKDFTFYPKELKPKFTKLRAPWTYMTKTEKKSPAFVRPKRWFPRKEYKKTQKQKVFGLTTSNGKSLCFKVPSPYTTELWAKDVKAKVGPFLKKAYPALKVYQILLDGEKLLHAPAAKAALKSKNVTILPGWPKYSPDLNPQENVWAWAEPELRRREKATDTFQDFGNKVVSAVSAYPVASRLKLIPAVSKRCKQVLEKGGAMLDN